MCGIAGAMKIENDKRYIHKYTFDRGGGCVGQVLNLLKATSIRGTDSCGVYLVGTDGTFNTMKCPTEGFDRLKQYNLSALTTYIKSSCALVSNSRAYPTQELVDKEITQSDIQPFESVRWVVTHNGIIANDEKIAAKFGVKRTTGTDTYVIPHALDKAGIAETFPLALVSLKRFFEEEVEGSFAMVLWDKLLKRMFFVTNFMPLYWTLYPSEDLLMVASEPEMLFPDAVNGVDFTYQQLGQDPHGQFKPYSVNSYDENSRAMMSLDFRKGNTSKKKVVISFSGGNDSMVNARLYQATGHDVNLVHFKYGQRAQELEERATKTIAENWGMPLHIVDVAPLFAQISKESILLNPTFKLKPEQRLYDAETTFAYVSNRNMIFGSIISGLAEQIGAGTAVININLGDSVYPDNGYPFMRKMEDLLNYSLNWHTKVRFTSPLVNLEKHEIIKLGIYLYGDFFNAVSCYYPTKNERGDVVNCGNCGCCLYRERAFLMAHYLDPQDYVMNTPEQKELWNKRLKMDLSVLDQEYKALAFKPHGLRPTATSIWVDPTWNITSIFERAVLFL